MTRLLERGRTTARSAGPRHAGTRDQAISRSVVSRFMGSRPSAITAVPSTAELGAHEVDPVLAPEHCAVDDKGRYGEHALLIRLRLVLSECRWPGARHEGIEARGIDADFLQERFDGGAILVVELALVEARKGGVDQRPALAAGVGEHPGEMNECRIEDLLRSPDDHAALVGEAGDVGVEVFYAAQTALGRLGIVHVVRADDVERVWAQAQRHAELPLQRIGRILGQEGIRAPEIEPEIDAFAHAGLEGPSQMLGTT